MRRERPFHPAQAVVPPSAPAKRPNSIIKSTAGAPNTASATNKVPFAKLPDISQADASRWVGTDPEPIAFTIGRLVPQGMTTLFVGEGGSGKTLLCQIAITCIPAGLPFLGKDTMGGNAAGLFAEDVEQVLHHRQVRINEALGVDMDALVGRHFVQSYSGMDATLWREHGPTSFMKELEAQLGRIDELRFVAIDNAALVFNGNENDRFEVTAFINCLNGMAQRLGVGVMLTTHLSKTSDGTTLRSASGSTAWVNAARSVLKLESANEPDRATLILLKANHVKPGDKTQLLWQDGVLIREPSPDSLEAQAHKRQIEKLILERVERAWGAENPLSDSPQASARYLPTVLSRTTDFKVKELKAEMQALQDDNFLAIGQRNRRTPRGLRIVRYPARPEYAGRGGVGEE